MPPGRPEGASCVQEFDDSLNSAIRITYRISLRSSSLREPRYPLLTVVRFVGADLTQPVFTPTGLIWGSRSPRDLSVGREGQRSVSVIVTPERGQKPSLFALPLNPHVSKRSLNQTGQRDLPEIASQGEESRIKVHGVFNVGYVLMILPQVHLRKPCYDFYFL